MVDYHTHDDFWRRMLLGQIPGLARVKRIMKALPAEPRCKLCFAPFGRPGSVVLRIFGNKPSPLNRRICTFASGVCTSTPEAPRSR
jgi:adenylate cyclase